MPNRIVYTLPFVVHLISSISWQWRSENCEGMAELALAPLVMRRGVVREI